MKLPSAEDIYPKNRQRKAFQKKMPNRAEIRFRAKTIATSLPRGIYSDRPKNNTTITLSLNVIHMSQSFNNTERFV